MPKFYVITDERSNLLIPQLLNSPEWSSVRNDILTYYPNGRRDIIQKDKPDTHFDFLGSILFSAMETGLKGTKSGWFFPHYSEMPPILTVETTNKKILPYFDNSILYLGYSFVE